ncbi:glycosyltransferase family 39 protein [Skermanella mucosa]|uniref:ArnT family glycosyltransferase n=1 Tax=Skermanella mucosa TaxID=1789672 RepID=UPI001E51DB1B|nr:glycosyltransferase family 39 protein [Skermanella mucosa]UEM20989.1 glycosyltransferase family 39 protein [Skermanella mucosa]
MSVADTPSGRSLPALLRRIGLMAALAALCLALFLPGFFVLPPTDRDEARFAQATRQMLESGDFVDIRFQDEARHKKPVGIYWMQSVAVTLAGGPEQAAIWAYRLPSLAGAVLAVLLTFRIGTTLFGSLAGERAGFLAAAMLAGTVLLAVEARTAKTDAALLATVLGAQAALAEAWLRRNGREALSTGLALLFWCSLGIGILLKGPIILLVVGGTALGLALAGRRVGWLAALRPRLGLPVLLLIVAPWLILITVKTQGAFFAESVGHDMLAKVAGGQESKGFPPGYYTLLFPVTFWPWSLLAIPAIPWVWANRRDPAVLFCLAWAVPTWIVFEAVPTKLFHYVLPAYPALALLTARAALDGFGGERRWLRLLSILLFLLIAAVLAAGLAALHAVIEWTLDPAALPLAVAVSAVLGYGALLFHRGGLRRSVAVVSAGSLGMYLLAFQVVLPRIEKIWISPRVAAAVAAARPCPDSTLVSIGFTEPSLVFLVGTGTVLSGDGRAAAHRLADDACALALVDLPQDDAFLAEAEAKGFHPIAIETISGLNYSRGTKLMMTLYRR